MGLFGTSGIRRLADRSLVELSLQVGIAVGSRYKHLVIASDTRTSNSVLRHAFLAGALSAGAKCKNAGIIPTPTLAFAAHDFDAGVMITASHNPAEYNGIKIFNPDGAAFSKTQENELENILNNGQTKASWREMHTEEIYDGAADKHIRRIIQDVPYRLNAKIVVDAGCGAAYDITPRLLTRLGCEVINLNCYPNGFFPHDLEPNETNLTELMSAVRNFGACLGIAHDGDADRMMAVDEKGRFIPGDKLLAILAREMDAKKIITTVEASMSVDEIGFDVVRTKVGDPYVSEQLKDQGEFGAEPSGVWFFPKVSLCPDGIYAAAKMAALASKIKLSELVDRIPSYPILRGSVKSEPVQIADLESEFMKMAPSFVDRTDGIKLAFSDGWLLIRPSGTEPKIRVTAEGKSENRARQLYNRGLHDIEEFWRRKMKT